VQEEVWKGGEGRCRRKCGKEGMGGCKGRCGRESVGGNRRIRREGGGEEERGKTREGRVRKGYVEEIGERWELERKDEGVTRQGRRILEYVSSQVILHHHEHLNLANNPTSL